MLYLAPSSKEKKKSLKFIFVIMSGLWYLKWTIVFWKVKFVNLLKNELLGKESVAVWIFLLDIAAVENL